MYKNDITIEATIIEAKRSEQIGKREENRELFSYAEGSYQEALRLWKIVGNKERIQNAKKNLERIKIKWEIRKKLE